VVQMIVSVGVCIVFWFGLFDWCGSLFPVIGEFILSSGVGFREFYSVALFRWHLNLFDQLWGVG